MVNAIEVFYSYSHKDEELRNELEKHLSILKRQGVITGWHDRKIGAGQEWAGQIDEHLNTARVILLLISADFLASDYCYDIEMKRAMERHEAKEALVIPVILRPVVWKGAPFGKLQALPKDAKAVTSWANRDEAFEDIARGIDTAVTTIATPPSVKVSMVRPPVIRQPFEPEMILIPAGEFLMGSDPKLDSAAYDAEQPQHLVYLPDYYLAKTPVTNAQYAAFVQATGREPPEYWEARTPPPHKTGHPVVSVTWYDAMDYCRWLAKVTGKLYRLPSEAEWEKGARGTDGRIYPWGNQWDPMRCNSTEGGKGDTTSVDAYPSGASSYGLLDMAGNVCEWTRSLWGRDFIKLDFRYPYDPNDGRENVDAPREVRRVLRGGAFSDNERLVRCASRSRGHPPGMYGHRGFRVVVSPL